MKKMGTNARRTLPEAFHAAGRILCFVVLAAQAGVGYAGPEAPVTSVLQVPKAFEPTVSIDPTDPSRIVVASIYGEFKGIWTWRTENGGASWTGDALTAPQFVQSQALKFAADPVADFTIDGVPILVSMEQGGAAKSPAGGVYVSRGAFGQKTWTSTSVFPDKFDNVAGQRLIEDKTWLVVDHGERSRYRGSVYATVGLRRMTPCEGEPYESPDTTICLRGVRAAPLDWQLLFSFSRDGGRTFSIHRVVDADSAAGFVAVEPNGAVDIIDSRSSRKVVVAGTSLIQRRSEDGGLTFGPAVTIARPKAGRVMGLPTVAVRPNGDLLVCWQEGIYDNAQIAEVRCASRAPGQKWADAVTVEPRGTRNVIAALPAAVGTDRGWYLLVYWVGSNRTEVSLMRSSDGRSFSRVATLRTADGLGRSNFCMTLWECNNEMPNRPASKFLPGHYVGLSASRGRLAAAYTLPIKGDPTKVAVYVTTLEEPPMGANIGAEPSQYTGTKPRLGSERR